MDATPLVASVAPRLTVTELVYQLLFPTVPEGVPVVVGDVVSTVVLASAAGGTASVLPAASRATEGNSYVCPSCPVYCCDVEVVTAIHVIHPVPSSLTSMRYETMSVTP